MLDLRTARVAMLEKLAPVAGIEVVALADARNRVLAESVVAEKAVPAADNSAMDGYVLQIADLTQGSEAKLPVRGEYRAGDPPGRLCS